MQCLAEASKTPVRTFFSFITHFYEKGCMVAADEAHADSGHVKIKRSCVDKLLTVFTENPNSTEKCIWSSFEKDHDSNSKNTRLTADAEYIQNNFDAATKFKNPSLYIDGLPYNELKFADDHFGEEQLIADVCAALFQNLMIKSNYCLHFLNTEYISLESYKMSHSREVGKQLKPRPIRPLGIFAICAGVVALIFCNCVTWHVVRQHQKRKL